MAEIDPLGMFVTELSDWLQPSGDGGSAVPVRGGRRYTGEEASPGHAAVPGDQPPFVLVRRLSRVRVKRLRSRSRIAVIAFGRNPVECTTILLRVAALADLRGPRVRPSGVAIYFSREEVGGQPGEDPDTGWPTEQSVYIVHAPAEAVASTP